MPILRLLKLCAIPPILKFNAGAWIFSSPAIEDGKVYLGSYAGKVYCLDAATGELVWAYRTGNRILASPAVANGFVFIGSRDNYVYCLDQFTGELVWRFKTGDEIHGHPSIADDGTIYIGSWDDYLYALNPDGTMKWKVGTGWGTSNCQSIDENGVIYVCTDKLYAFYPNGTLKWSFNLGDWCVGKSSPAISSEGIIYIGLVKVNDDGGAIIAINPDGTERWRKTIAKYSVESSPSIAKDGTLYIDRQELQAGR